MKSRATRKGEVTRHVISCKPLFISDYSIKPPARGYLISKILIYFSIHGKKINFLFQLLLVKKKTENKSAWYFCMTPARRLKEPCNQADQNIFVAATAF